jgi:intein/homing endonuclease
MNLALTTTVTRKIPTVVVKEIIENSDNLIFINDYEGSNDKPHVFLNGILMGITLDPEAFITEMKAYRENGLLDKEVSFSFNDDDIRIFCDEGRFIRPLLTVNDATNRLNITEKDDLSDWDKLVEKQFIQYVDNSEIQSSVIAMDEKDLVNHKNDFFEICPAMMLGVMASAIPYPDHNQSPRNIYQCLSPETDVLMHNGERKQIKDVKIGDKVMTFNPKTMQTSITNVINQYVRPTENKIFKIKTVSGREIIATGNHNFMTTDGWKSVDTMEINKTKIGILLHPKHMSNFVENRQLILDEEKLYDILSTTKMSDKLILKHIYDLKMMGLLPLYNDYEKLEIISRIYGFTCTDGSINVYEKKGVFASQCQYDFSTENDAMMFEDDLEKLGFSRCSISEQIAEYDGSTYHTWCVSHNASLPSFLIALGISCGKKTENKRNKIPDWVMNGSDNVKREFVSGFQGGDGCQIRWNRLKNRKSYNFVCAMTSQQINPIYSESLEFFFKQLETLLKFFDIECFTENKKVEENRIEYRLKISDKQENLIKYYDTIGYRYAYYKIVNSGKVVEYLKFKNIIVDNHKIEIGNIRKEIDNNLSNRQIADMFNIKIEKISDIRRSYKNNRQISSPDLHKYKVEDWMSDIVDDKLNSIFVPISSIEELPNQMISDITVESENHSFIAGDNFLSSNSSMGQKQAQVIKNYC